MSDDYQLDFNARTKMGELRLTVKIEAEVTDDVSDETLEVVKIQIARRNEYLEANLVDSIQKSCPELRIASGREGDECNL